MIDSKKLRPFLKRKQRIWEEESIICHDKTRRMVEQI